MKIAVVTVLYPAVSPFLEAFFASLSAQTNPFFDVWIGLDNISEKCVPQNLYHHRHLHLIQGLYSTTPSELRNTVFMEAAQNSDVMVMVDADDVLTETRVEAALESAEKWDLTAAAMVYINNTGAVLEGIFNPELGDVALVRNNVYGLSNTTWRSKTF